MILAGPFQLGVFYGFTYWDCAHRNQKAQLWVPPLYPKSIHGSYNCTDSLQILHIFSSRSILVGREIILPLQEDQTMFFVHDDAGPM